MSVKCYKSYLADSSDKNIPCLHYFTVVQGMIAVSVAEAFVSFYWFKNCQSNALQRNHLWSIVLWVIKYE